MQTIIRFAAIIMMIALAVLTIIGASAAGLAAVEWVVGL